MRWMQGHATVFDILILRCRKKCELYLHAACNYARMNAGPQDPLPLGLRLATAVGSRLVLREEENECTVVPCHC